MISIFSLYEVECFHCLEFHYHLIKLSKSLEVLVSNSEPHAGAFLRVSEIKKNRNLAPANLERHWLFKLFVHFIIHYQFQTTNTKTYWTDTPVKFSLLIWLQWMLIISQIIQCKYLSPIDTQTEKTLTTACTFQNRNIKRNLVSSWLNIHHHTNEQTISLLKEQEDYKQQQ